MKKTRGRSSCAGCVHCRPLAVKYSNSENVCHYILDTGHMRECSAADCTMNTKRKGAATA